LQTNAALSKLRNFGGWGGVEHPKPPAPRYATGRNGRELLKRLKLTVGCNASKRRRRRSEWTW